LWPQNNSRRKIIGRSIEKLVTMPYDSRIAK
jgi:hypothetical protein